VTELNDIFSRLNAVAAARQAEEPAPNTEKCVCNGTKLYIKVSPQGKELAVCPQCNPRTKCIKCSGTGHLTHFNLETLNNDVIPFGCACTTLEKRVAAFKHIGVPHKYLDVAFSVLDTSHLNPEQTDKFTANQDVVYNFCTLADDVIQHGVVGSEPYFLVLMGPVGTGKTHLGISALRRLVLEFGHSAKFVDFQTLLQDLKVWTRRSAALFGDAWSRNVA
jgi:DNA replication protein DnaC